MKNLFYIFFLSQMYISGKLLNIINENNEIILLCIILSISDIFIAILSKYLKNKHKEVQSDIFAKGIIFKIIFFFLLVISGLLLDTITGINIKETFILCYVLYEIKSIDENISKITGKSFIDKIIDTILFFKKKKNELQQ